MKKIGDWGFLLLVGFLFFYSPSVKAFTLNSKDVTIYYYDEALKEYNISLPKEYSTTYTLKVDSKTNIVPEFEVENSGIPYISVSSDGVIKAKDAGTAKIQVKVDREIQEVTVHVVDYLDFYVEQILDEFIQKNITSEMTDYQKLQKFARYVADFSYSGNPSYQWMILKEEGDCIASSNLIIRLCEKVGIQAYMRYAVNEPGAGLNHRNVTALADGKVYKVEAGYNETAPRDYTIEEEKDGFWFAWKADSMKGVLLQYDGFSEDVTIPSSFSIDTIDGVKTTNVEIIASKAFTNPTNIGTLTLKTVHIPNTVTTIEEYAFQDCKDLTTVYIPASVSSLDARAFENCSKLTNLIIDSDNPYYTVENGVVYNKNKTEVIMVVPGYEGKITLASTVQKINSYAFTTSDKITSVELGNNVKTIEEFAFYKSGIETVNIPKSVQTIGEEAFSYSDVRFIRIEEGCTATIPEGAFFSCGNLLGIILPKTISSIDASAFRATKSAVFYVENNSPALTFAKNQQNSYEVIDASKKQILSAMIFLSPVSYTYDGKAKQPTVTVVDGGKVLIPDVDYTYTYQNNVDVSNNAQVVVTGKGSYSGSSTQTFTIHKAESDVEVQLADVVFGETIKPTIVPNLAGAKVTQIYYNTIHSSQGLSSTPPTEVGTYYMKVNVLPNDYNYSTKSIWLKFQIIRAENDLSITCSNFLYGTNGPTVTVLTNKSGGSLTYYYKKQGADDTTYTTTVPKMPGKYTVKAVSTATKNYNSKAATANFEITMDPSSYIKGDINQDLSIDVLDAREVLYMTVGRKQITSDALLRGDMDENAKIEANDAVEIMRLYVGKK